MRTARVHPVLLAVLGLYLAGCSQEAKDEYSQAGRDQAKATEMAGKAIQTDANRMMQNGANEIQSAKFKQALNTADALDARNIRVDADTVSKTVRLSGSVPTEAQKSQAERVTAGMAGPEYKVFNQLNVVPQAP